MPALRFAPHGEAASSGGTRNLPRRPHRIEYRIRGIGADQKRVHRRAGEADIVGCDNDIARPNRVHSRRILKEIGTERRRAFLGDAPRTMSPCDHAARTRRNRFHRRGDDARHGEALTAAIGGPILHAPGLCAGRRIGHWLCGNEVARRLGRHG